MNTPTENKPTNEKKIDWVEVGTTFAIFITLMVNGLVCWVTIHFVRKYW